MVSGGELLKHTPLGNYTTYFPEPGVGLILGGACLPSMEGRVTCAS